MNNATVHVLMPNASAPKEIGRLFAGLELLANLGDSYPEYCEFVKKYPTFCPVILFDESTNRQLELLQNESAHELFKVFRDYLRSVWRREPAALREQVQQILLGVATRPLGCEPLDQNEALQDHIPERIGATDWNERLEARSVKMFENFPPRYRRAMMLMKLHPDSRFFRPYFPKIMADWESGEVFFELRTDFQRAVYALFRQSWRARVCRECQKLFVAVRHPQMFCSAQCSMTVKLRRNRAFWKNRGTVQRRKRNQERRRSRKKAK